MLDDVPEFVVLLLAGIAAGALNSVGGAGKFVALPALVATGTPPVLANAAASVALAPGAAASAWVYRRELAPVGPVPIPALTLLSVLGALTGAGLLLVAPSTSFEGVVPWLLAFATVVLAVGKQLPALLGAVLRRPGRLGARSVLIGQFVLGIYGGYFGGAVGIMMFAFWGAGLGLDAARANPMRVAQLAAMYLPASVLFLFASDVLAAPLPLLTLLAGSVFGGLVGAHVAKRMPDWLMRTVVLCTAATMTVLYFLRG